MSRFYASIHGKARTQATRCGSASSGCTGHIRGWDIGAQVIAEPEWLDHDKDVIEIRVTGGSNGYFSAPIGRAERDEKGNFIFIPSEKIRKSTARRIKL
jgi:hypothetical protein